MKINKKMNIQTIQGRQHKMYSKYSSSQTYVFTKVITQIIQQKTSSNTAEYQDLQYYLDDDEYLKRYYQNNQFKNKMNIFKQYYFYHVDCPRIFLKDIQIPYAKWQDRKRNLVYKKLKHILNQDKQDKTITETQQSMHGNTHVLYDLSEYNPFSKKYYLRIQNKKIMPQKVLGQQYKNTKSRDQISFLKHDLSNMLKQMNQLSVISTLDYTRIQSKTKIYHKKSMTQAQAASGENSNHNNSNSIIKLNFKKKRDNQKLSHQKLIFRKNSKQLIFDGQKQKQKYNIQPIQNTNKRVSSPNVKPSQQILISKEKSKSKSIYEFTTLGKLGQDKNRIKTNSRRENLKLNLQTKGNKQFYQCYGSEIKKLETVDQGFERKRTITIRTSSLGKLKGHKQQDEGLRGRQISVRKFKTKQDQFSDKKVNQISKKDLRKLSSYKSEQIDPKKALFKIKPTQTISYKKKLQIKL